MGSDIQVVSLNWGPFGCMEECGMVTLQVKCLCDCPSVSGTHLYFCHAILKHIPKRKTNYGGVTSRVYDEPPKKSSTIRGTATTSWNNMELTAGVTCHAHKIWGQLVLMWRGRMSRNISGDNTWKSFEESLQVCLSNNHNIWFCEEFPNHSDTEAQLSR